MPRMRAAHVCPLLNQPEDMPRGQNPEVCVCHPAPLPVEAAHVDNTNDVLWSALVQLLILYHLTTSAARVSLGEPEDDGQATQAA